MGGSESRGCRGAPRQVDNWTPAVQTSMCVQADLGHCPILQDLRAVESLLLGYNALQGGFEEKWNM
jgi:hypothetical protein